ncbi:hypothetical protein [Spirosoma koreense]
MKALIKPLLLALTVSFASAAMAETNPSRPTAVATFKTGIYTNTSGKLNIALDKDKGGAVDVLLKSSTGKILFAQHIGKKETTSRLRLDMSELQDGTYQVDITNGVATTTHTVTLSTQQPSAPGRLVALN